MAHAAKYAKGATGQLCQHYERKIDEKGEYVKLGNQDIAPSKTPENYNLAPEREMGQVGFIKQRTSEVKCLNRADVKVMCSWVITLPKDFPKAQERDFFEQSYKFLANRYGGEKNVISAYVHKDEHQPHMHFAFVPVVLDQKKGIEKVSAKSVFHLRELKSFHGDMSKHMERHFERDVGLLNGATKDGNKSIAEMKRGSASYIINKAKEQANHIIEQSKAKAAEIVTITNEDARKHVEKTIGMVKPLEEKKIALESQISSLESKLKTVDRYILNLREIEEIQGKKTTFSDNIILSKKEFDKMKITATEGVKLMSKNVDLQFNYDRYKDIYERMNKNFKPLQEENMQLKKDLRDQIKSEQLLEQKLDGVIQRRDSFLDQHNLNKTYDNWKENVWDKNQVQIKAPSMERG